MSLASSSAWPVVVAFLSSVAMWHVMMTVMMLPVALPWFRAFAHMHPPASASASEGASVGAGRNRPSFAGVTPRLLLFASGYFCVWGVFSTAAGATQLVLRDAGLLAGNFSLSGRAGGLLLAGAGFYQLTPAKVACLRHCRNPLTYFLTRWRNGPRSAFTMGMVHGIFCLGCCWALMSLAFVAGVMNLAWMAVLTTVMLLESLARPGPDWRVAIGASALIGGVAKVVVG